MLDHVQAGRVLEQPARENLQELVLGAAFLHQQLHKGARFLGHLPRRGALAGLKADDHVAHALLLARPQFEVAADIVALVEQAERCNALLHRGSDPRLIGRLHGQFALLEFCGDFGLHCRFGRRGLLLARGYQRDRQDEGKRPAHRHASGDQAS